MQLSIHHVTEYRYAEPVGRGFQRLRLTPPATQRQSIDEWHTTVVGGRKEVAFHDHFGNYTELVSITPGAETLRITSSGIARTQPFFGMQDDPGTYVPRWLYLRSTALTEAGSGVQAMLDQLPEDKDPLVRMERLNLAVADTVKYETGRTTIADPAEDVLAAGFGVCQDHTHVFVAAARSLGVPARYVSGYLKLDAAVEQDASHAWGEAWVDGIGWVGFDPSNRMSPDERYVRIAVGLDYTDTSPVAGVRFGTGDEELTVGLRIEEHPTQ